MLLVFFFYDKWFSINLPDIKIGSVSYDDNIEEWKTALTQTQMGWEQLLMPADLKIYQYDLFQFDGSLPTTIIIDSNGKIIYKSIGVEQKEGLGKMEGFIEGRLGSGM